MLLHSEAQSVYNYPYLSGSLVRVESEIVSDSIVLQSPFVPTHSIGQYPFLDTQLNTHARSKLQYDSPLLTTSA